jgi:hypothetical protein
MSHTEDENRVVPPKHRDAHGPSTAEPAALDSGEQEQAAQMIQRNYRGYRTRRQLNGMGLDASSRWAEVKHRLHLWHVAALTCVYRLSNRVSFQYTTADTY